MNKPENILAISVELQGIRLVWNDKSNYEDGYKIEKDAGSGYQEIVSVDANMEIYMDAISGIPASPLSLTYRLNIY